METVFVTKTEFYDSFAEMDQKFSILQSAVDKCLKDNIDFRVEMRAMNHRLGLHDGWIVKAAKTIKVSYSP